MQTSFLSFSRQKIEGLKIRVKRFLCLIIVALTSCAPRSVDDQQAMELTNEVKLDGLAERIDRTLQTELTGRKLSSADNAAWQIMHGVICYGHDLPLETPDRGTVKALDYAFHGGNIRGWQLSPGQNLPDGRRGVKALLEPGSYIGQGHVDQWIAICAMAELPAEDQVVIDGTITPSWTGPRKPGWTHTPTR